MVVVHRMLRLVFRRKIVIKHEKPVCAFSRKSLDQTEVLRAIAAVRGGGGDAIERRRPIVLGTKRRRLELRVDCDCMRRLHKEQRAPIVQQNRLNVVELVISNYLILKELANKQAAVCLWC